MRFTSMTVSALVTGTVLSTSAFAQWSSDSTMHQLVADGSGEQVQPKIVATPDGGCYISWYSSDSGYDVRLQRLDSQGNEMWAHNGVLVADRGFSSTEDYGLDIDSNGNAVLAFRDDRFGGVVVTAQSIAPDGSALWGANGVQMGNSADSIHSPDIASTSDGKAVVGWINNLNTNLTQIDGSGSVVWNTSIADTSGNGESINLASMHQADNGAVIVSWIQYGFFLGPKDMMAQKIDSSGNEAWASRVAVYDGGSIQLGNFPEFVSDGAGGAVFSWYDTFNSLNVYAQHVLSDGTEAFGHNGAVVSTSPRERVSPSAAYDSATDSVIVSWVELDNNQGSQGVYTQRLDNTGSRMWSNSGVEITPPDSNASGSINVQVIDGIATTLWIENTGTFAQDNVLAHGLTMAGDEAWVGGIVPVASDNAQRARLATAASTAGFVIAGWQIGDFGVADLQTHNLNSDGSLGAAAPCLADLNGDGYLDFLDISAFLAAYNSQMPLADLNGDGEYDFLDISAFLTSYNSGCP